MIRNILDNKKVRFIAIDKKYILEPYRAVAPFSEQLNNYVTGQNCDPDVKDPLYSKNCLTKEEIEGVVPVSNSKLSYFSNYIIKSDTVVLIVHAKEYDCRLKSSGKPVNPHDYWSAYFIINLDFVAINESSKTPKHLFYLDDRIAKAKELIEHADLVYQAEKLVREELNADDYIDFIIAAQYVSGSIVYEEGMTDLEVKSKLLKLAKNEPNVVIDIMKRGKDMLLIGKFLSRGVLKKKLDGFYDSNKLVGVTIDDIVDFIKAKKNTDIVSRWVMLLEKENA